MPKIALPVVANAAEATFECIFGRGCDGICCKNGRPSVDASEQAAIAAVLPRVLEHLRPEARRLIEREGFLSNRTKLKQPMLRVVGGWCVFFNAGCTLHKVGAADGDSYQYKPSQCALFPLEKGDDDAWFIRQWGYRGEQWDLFCLSPQQSRKPAIEALAAELALAGRFEAANREPAKARHASTPERARTRGQLNGKKSAK
jgi:Fe-S-cluster containining protein